MGPRFQKDISSSEYKIDIRIAEPLSLQLIGSQLIKLCTVHFAQFHAMCITKFLLEIDQNLICVLGNLLREVEYCHFIHGKRHTYLCPLFFLPPQNRRKVTKTILIQALNYMNGLLLCCSVVDQEGSKDLRIMQITERLG